MKTISVVCITMLLLVTVSTISAQPGVVRPEPPEGYELFTWTIVGSNLPQLLNQFVTATGCLGYIGGFQAVPYTYQGNAEYILFWFYRDDHISAQVYNDVIWYLSALYPYDWGRYNAVAPLQADQLCPAVSLQTEHNTAAQQRGYFYGH